MDMSWLATEAKSLHEIFNRLFYIMITLALLSGVVVEYFKFALGGLPQFSQLVGRVLTAAILLVLVPEIMNTLAGVTDAVVSEIGGLTQFGLVMQRMGEKLGGLTVSWVSFRDVIILVISFFELLSSLHNRLFDGFLFCLRMDDALYNVTSFGCALCAPSNCGCN